MIWGKIVNGELQYAPPETYDENGVVKELRRYDDLTNEGYKRVISNKPVYNPYTQYLLLDKIVEEDNIYISYIVKDIEEGVSTSELEEMIDEEGNKE